MSAKISQFGTAKGPLGRARYLSDKKTTAQRLLARRQIDEQTGCWELRGRKKGTDYHCVYWRCKMTLVHRLAAWIWLGFDIESEILVLHKCDNPICWNPKHLFQGTNADNALDRERKGRHGDGGGKANRAKTHCRHGHEYSFANTYRYPNGRRSCRTCRGQFVEEQTLMQ
jgi:hypothetical protein